MFDALDTGPQTSMAIGGLGKGGGGGPQYVHV